MEVEHVKAHRTEKDKKEMTQFERSFVTDGSEKADELAKAGAMLDEGFTAQTRAKTVQQGRKEVYAALQYAASFHCLVDEWKDCEELKPQPKEKWTCVDMKREESKQRAECCANASKYRCIRCGRGSKYKKMHENVQGRNTWGIFWEMRKATSGRTRYGEKNGQARSSFDLVQKMLRLRTTENETKN